jgi:hypothetical protein
VSAHKLLKIAAHLISNFERNLRFISIFVGFETKDPEQKLFQSFKYTFKKILGIFNLFLAIFRILFEFMELGKSFGKRKGTGPTRQPRQATFFLPVGRPGLHCRVSLALRGLKSPVGPTSPPSDSPHPTARRSDSSCQDAPPPALPTGAVGRRRSDSCPNAE